MVTCFFGGIVFGRGQELYANLLVCDIITILLFSCHAMEFSAVCLVEGTSLLALLCYSTCPCDLSPPLNIYSLPAPSPTTLYL